MTEPASQSERRVVVTGLGVATPLGIGMDALWDGLLARQSGIRPIQAFDASGLGHSFGGEVPAFKVADYVPKGYRKSTKVMARDIELAVVAAYEAVKNAGLRTKCMIDRGEAQGGLPNVDPTRFGANIGAGLICADLQELAGALATAGEPDGSFSLIKWGKEGMENLTPLWLLKFLPNMLGCHVTIVHDCQAPSNTITCADASSHLAIGEAFRTIARGRADVCICGGAESKINPMGVARQQLLGRLAESAQAETACRPFAADRSGLVVSEGGGLLILEALEHAKARGARIYAEVAGFGASCNTHDWLTPHPEGLGIAGAVRAALSDAKMGAADIDLIGTFGTGTRDYDASEFKGIHAVLGPRCGEIPAIAVKGAIGHNGAGSGAIDAAVTIMSLYQNTLPPSLNAEPPDPRATLRFVNAGPVDSRARSALSVSYALHGGQNAALVFKRYQE